VLLPPGSTAGMSTADESAGYKLSTGRSSTLGRAGDARKSHLERHSILLEAPPSGDSRLMMAGMATSCKPTGGGVTARSRRGSTEPPPSSRIAAGLTSRTLKRENVRHLPALPAAAEAACASGGSANGAFPSGHGPSCARTDTISSEPALDDLEWHPESTEALDGNGEVLIEKREVPTAQPQRVLATTPEAGDAVADAGDSEASTLPARSPANKPRLGDRPQEQQGQQGQQGQPAQNPSGNRAGPLAIDNALSRSSVRGALNLNA